MDKRFLSIVAVIILAFVGFVIFSGDKKDSNSSSSGSSGSSQLSNHVKGNENAKVTLLEYGDFQCPYCQQYHATVNQVVEANKDKIKFQFRNFPLVSLHQNAFAAARAAEAAALQGKYWEMHDMLYDMANWGSWSESTKPSELFEQYAKQLGLNVNKFKTDFSGERVNKTINADLKAGNDLDITSTPTFLINGKKVQLNNDPAAFQEAIDKALKEAN